MSIICIEWAHSLLWKGVRMMLKRSMLVLCAIAFLALGACGSPNGKNSGLLTDEEIGKYESLYLMDDETVFNELGVSEKDIDRESDYGKGAAKIGSYVLKEPRSIAGADFEMTLTTSTLEPEGLYGVRFHTSFMEKEDAQAAVKAIYEQAVERYGEPFHDAYSPSYLSNQLDDPTHGFESWEVGEFTELNLQLFDVTNAANFSPDWDYRYSLDIEYRVRRTVDGKLLTVDEVLEMVKDIQQK